MRTLVTGEYVEFDTLAQPLLRRDPLRHTVIATILANRGSGLDDTAGPAHLVALYDADTVCGIAVRAPGREIVLGGLPSSGIAPVAAAFAEVVPEAAAVEGDRETARDFAARWSELRGVDHALDVVTRLYRLDVLRPPEVAGAARRAGQADAGLCADWMAAMSVEAGVRPITGGEAGLRRRIAAGRWWLWECHGQPVALAAHQADAHGWSRIGPVYTPPEHRGHGYASAITARVSGLLRGRGVEPCLFTDLDNPTSNRIYRALGFVAVGDHHRYTLG